MILWSARLSWAVLLLHMLLAGAVASWVGTPNVAHAHDLCLEGWKAGLAVYPASTRYLLGSW